MNWQSEREQRFYAELFQSCDTEGTGKISGIQAAELFRSARLGQDVLVQVINKTFGSQPIISTSDTERTSTASVILVGWL